MTEFYIVSYDVSAEKQTEFKAELTGRYGWLDITAPGELPNSSLIKEARASMDHEIENIKRAARNVRTTITKIIISKSFEGDIYIANDIP